MEGYFAGCLGQVNVRSTSSTPDIEEYIALRRGSIGVYPCLALVEWVYYQVTQKGGADRLSRYMYKLDILDEVFEHPAVKQIESIASDVVVLYVAVYFCNSIDSC